MPQWIFITSRAVALASKEVDKVKSESKKYGPYMKYVLTLKKLMD